jgi:hypothetical protein
LIGVPDGTAVRSPALPVLALAVALLAQAACDREQPSVVRDAPPIGTPATPARSAALTPELPAISSAEFARLFRELSEPDRYFFSDNFVSNETSYLQVVPLLDTRGRKGGGYVGVGPEQNFTYIALLEPELAFVVDIRRQNALQHLLFKALFDEAESRAHFLALLFGRPWQPPGNAGKDPTIAELLSQVERSKPERAVFDETLRRLIARITDGFGISLSKQDRQTIERTHRAFFDDQLELRFELHDHNARKYPSLGELLAARDPGGAARGFLASEDRFRVVRTLHRKHRIIPVVGDFAGNHALQAVGEELRKRDLPLNAFYVSNVEQYLLEPGKWRPYVANVDALPADERSLFIRCYLDQGRRHPQQMKGHRTATVLQHFDHFKWRQRTRGYGTFWQLAIDGNLGADDDGGN